MIHCRSLSRSCLDKKDSSKRIEVLYTLLIWVNYMKGLSMQNNCKLFCIGNFSNIDIKV